ncbi:MAG: 1-deoxy-D-xylulose-5-phosphate reductoisomerase [Thermoanaerobacteraceae bacterium]
MKNIIIFGSTGSIGRQTLDVLRNLKNDFKVVGLTAYNNVDLLLKQCEEFLPEVVVLKDEEKRDEFNARLKSNIKVLTGDLGLQQLAREYNADLAVIALEGISGLMPTVEAIKSGKNIALATKEVLVTAGKLITDLINIYNVSFLPIDSEHCAIHQCLQGNKKEDISRLILTASGGPFRGMKTDFLKTVSVEQTLKHPNWNMGKKITVDSATLMNKGFEVIEAKWFFNVEPEKIDVVIHPQSIIHSMVEYKDGSIIAQMATTDMRIPIQYAINYPRRCHIKEVKFLDFALNNTLTFEKPDVLTFRGLTLAFDALKTGGSMTAVLNAADEAAVNLFLNKKINFLDIYKIVEENMNKHKIIENPTLSDIINIDKEIKNKILKDYMR